MRKVRPILFTGPNVQNILSGRKHLTRREMKPQPQKNGAFWEWGGAGWSLDRGPVPCVPRHSMSTRCPYGTPGDLLYVKEAAWMWCERVPNGTTPTGRAKYRYAPLRSAPVHYVADHPERPTVDVASPCTGNQWGWRYKAARFLPRWATRITLVTTCVRIERLQDISEADALAEGAEAISLDSEIYATAKDVFSDIWESINGPGAWARDPWVWVVEFQPHHMNADRLLEESRHG